MATEELRPVTDNYSEEELIGRQVLVVVNVPVNVVAGAASEVLVFAGVSEAAPAMLIEPDITVTDGLRCFED